MTRVALTIAGSDPSGGAGIQADLKTFHQHGVYGAAALALITVQNTRNVAAVHVLDPALVVAQVRAVVDDLAVHAAKTGALGSAAVVDRIAELARSFAFPLVVDPVMISKHGAPLIDDDARSALRDRLLPHVALITPNRMEAEWLAGFAIADRRAAVDAAKAIAQRGARAVLVKGGHLEERDAVDVLWVDGEAHEISAPRIDTKHTHGTGCTYSAAITARLALGEDLLAAICGAKGWLTEALRNPPTVGGGIGPVDHLAPITRPSVAPRS